MSSRFPAWVIFVLDQFRDIGHFRAIKSRMIGRRYVVPILVIRNVLTYINTHPRKRLCIANDNATAR